MRAKDVMTTNVISVSENSPIREVVSLLLKYRISAVPVVDGAQKVVGIVSEGDLLRPEGMSPAGTRRSSWMEAVVAGQAGTNEKGLGRTAGAVMTRNVITVDEDTPLNEIARLLERHRIKRVPVLSNGRIAGIVSRANLMRGLADMIKLIERFGPVRPFVNIVEAENRHVAALLRQFARLRAVPAGRHLAGSRKRSCFAGGGLCGWRPGRERERSALCPPPRSGERSPSAGGHAAAARGVARAPFAGLLPLSGAACKCCP